MAHVHEREVDDALRDRSKSTDDLQVVLRRCSTCARSRYRPPFLMTVLASAPFQSSVDTKEYWCFPLGKE
ncbi:hypothetical protein PsorP6_004205 [Peronosclerospora sorghi]|uniref:Uncharacterized protein n=1 Tax=Peronosclerospora sorghi TaxID=230839 RepID=A0ACC0VK06_9STRA|nr:hypothetical protein PsorP6_004205 [Peronosclerospora sorghi]